MNPQEKAHFDANQALWDAKVPVHLDSSFYDMAAFRAGASSLQAIEREGMGDVAGKSLLHLQCHFGQDTLSWAREGATVTGIDLSTKAIETARSISKELNIPATFVCCNLYDLKEHLSGQFDIVFTSYGTIGWLPDLDRWAEVITHFLRPGGTFYIADFHPYLWMLDDAFKQVQYSYFNVTIIEEITEGSYADRDAPIQGRSFSWNHPLSEVVTALISHGLQIESLQEYDYTPWDCFPGLKKIGDRKWVFEHVESKVPYVYSIRAQKE
jgi:2-polyprenyl-3-methyl-5-hydroxy-6-metoxy-1,4-benzoquinol methylase